MKCTIISLVLFVIVLAEVGPVHCDYSDNLGIKILNLTESKIDFVNDLTRPSASRYS